MQTKECTGNALYAIEERRQTNLPANPSAVQYNTGFQ